MNVPAPTGTQGVKKDDITIPSADELLEHEGSPLWRDQVARCQRVAVWVVSLGAVPGHVCLVPDGHRRFSRDTSTDLRRVYAVGAHKYAKVREWWFRAGVEVLSVFMFSVRNFSRNSFDMTSALNQANQIHVDIVDNVDAFRAMGMQSCACGDLERLPEELRASLARSEIATSSIREKSLKIQMSCAAYNTTYQMSRMARHLATAIKEGIIYTKDLTAAFLDEYVSLTECPPAELLLRSAGDQRFSDFEVLQCNYAHFHLGSKKWPAVGFGDWLRAMIEFQLNWPAIEAVKEKHAKMTSYGSGRSDPEQVIRQRKFLRHVHVANILNMERLAGLHNGVM
nr:dehydrodolichyl diphosphate synthase complex subunit DHDDS-like [Rhipicephalus microplus]